MKTCSICIICCGNDGSRPKELASTVPALREEWLLTVAESYGMDMQTEPHLVQ